MGARLARVTHVVSLVILGVVTAAALVGAQGGQVPPDPFFGVVIVVVVAGYTTLGRLIVTRTGNPIGWIFLGMGAALAFGLPAETYLQASYDTPYVASLPGTAAAGLAASVAPGVAAITVPMLFLLFPTGRPPTRRWRWVGWLWVASAALSFVWLTFRPGSVYGEPKRFTVVNPIGVSFLPSLRVLLFDLATTGVLVAALVSIVSLVVRFRRARGDERQQIKWLMLVGVVALAIFVLMAVLNVWIDEGEPAAAVGNAFWLLLVLDIAVGIPVATALAIFRYRLYDVDVVISKTIVYAGLALFIGAAYVAIVVGAGALLGGDETSTAIRIAATAAVALAFQPARDRLQAFANRLVYGRRASPYEVMAEFGHRVAEAPFAGELLPQMAEAAGRGVGGTAARVTVFLDGQGERSVTWPADAELDTPTLELPVAHAGEPVGQIAVVKPPREPLRPAERALLEDLAGHAGLALHNVRLTAELEAKAEELARRAEEIRRSRERLVTARDTQRRRLERDLRDGVGAELAAIRDAIDADAARVASEAAAVQGRLAELGERANAALEELRDVARGVFPPLLADQGLAAALEAHARKAAVPPPEIDSAVRAGRFDAAAENAVYFCCVQALQNALRHASGSAISLEVSVDGGDLSFVVRDDGPGFDTASVEEREGIQIMRDRVAALDGVLTIDSRLGRGTTVRGVVPAGLLEEATP